MRVDQQTQSATMSPRMLRPRSATPYNDDDAENECLEDEDDGDVNLETTAKPEPRKDPAGKDEDDRRADDDDGHEPAAEDDDELGPAAEDDDELEPPANVNEFAKHDESPADDDGRDAEEHDPPADDVEKASVEECATNDADALVPQGETAEDKFIEDEPAEGDELTDHGEHARPSYDMDVAHESGSDESDYGETQARKEEIRRIQIKKGLLRSRSPTNQELEEEDLEDDVDYAEEAVPESSPRIHPAAKGKKSTTLEDDDLDDEGDQEYDQDPNADNIASDGGEIEDEDTEYLDDSYPRRAGPLPAAARAAAFALHKTYDREMTAIARKYGKPPQSLFRLVGQDNSIPHAISVWNAYQAWYASHGAIQKPKDSAYTSINYVSYLIFIYSVTRRMDQNCAARVPGSS